MSSSAREQDRVDRFRAAYLDNYLSILGYALRRTPTADDAADVVAETFLVLWRRLDQAPTGAETRPWLYGIARRVLSNGQRSERRRTRLSGRLQGARLIDEVQWTSAAEDLVSEVMDQLSPRDREVLRLSAWEGLVPTEIAIVLECSPNAAKLRLHRARRRFAYRLELQGVRVTPTARPGHGVHERVIPATEEEV
jgi:RNA polymerase sigma-70 factor (ECF subfamily)